VNNNKDSKKRDLNWQESRVDNMKSNNMKTEIELIEETDEE
jgi:hypothetical protein